MVTHLFGLIGRSLGHSFSQKYFSKKFAQLGIDKDYQYKLFELAKIEDLLQLIQSAKNLKGFNVTIPYKQAISPFLDEIEPSAKAVGAVNTVKVHSGKLIGYNTDLYGFKRSFQETLAENNITSSSDFALILGNGGAAKAVKVALQQLGWQYQTISRKPEPGQLTYQTLPLETLQEANAIINTTPLGMYPKIEDAPQINYESISPKTLCFDLVYNPTKTKFMELAEETGAFTKNGLDMLHYQADRAWEIWQKDI